MAHELEGFGGVTAIDARRVGLISDDHYEDESGRDLPDMVLRAFDGVDLILHLGHMVDGGGLGDGVLDRLQSVAPVLGVQYFTQNADDEKVLTPPDGARVAGLARVVEAGPVRIGAVHNLGTGPGPQITVPPGGSIPPLDHPDLAELVAAKFGSPVDVVAFGGTHRPVTLCADGMLFVNPGSPTYPRGPGWKAREPAPGTVGILHLHDGVAAFELVELTRPGLAAAGSTTAEEARELGVDL
jgi:uncharacterized protein